MGKKMMAGVLLTVALTFGSPNEARAGCVTRHLHCLEWAWSLDSYWETFWGVDLCHRLYTECLYDKLLGW
jgi:hypothetical protein